MEKGRASEMIMKQILLSSDLDTEAEGPTVISCGGIYIPHSGDRERTIYHIINTSSSEEPVKVVTGRRPRNVLFEILSRESMN